MTFPTTRSDEKIDYLKIPTRILRITFQLRSLDPRAATTARWIYTNFTRAVAMLYVAYTLFHISDVINQDHPTVFEKTFCLFYCIATPLCGSIIFNYQYHEALLYEMRDIFRKDFHTTSKYRLNGVEPVSMVATARRVNRLAVGTFVLFFIGMGSLPFSLIFKNASEHTRVFPLHLQRFDFMLATPFFQLFYAIDTFVAIIACQALGQMSCMFAIISSVITQQLRVLQNNMAHVLYNAMLANGTKPALVAFFFANFNECLTAGKLTSKEKQTYASQLSREFLRGHYDRAIHNELASCIQHHQTVLRACRLAESYFTCAVFFVTFISTVIIAISLFVTVKNFDLQEIGIYIVYLIMYVTMIFVTGYYGTQITYENSKVLNAIYRCPWYLMNAECQKIILIMHINAHMPIVMTGGKFCILSLQQFLQIIKTSYSCVTLLLRVGD